jgi:hypothetical protein
MFPKVHAEEELEMKFVTFAAAPPGQNFKEFQEWFAVEYAPGMVKALSLRGCIMRRRLDLPGFAPFENYNLDPEKDMAPFDVVMESWFPAPDDFRREIMPLEQKLKEAGSRHITYSVTARLQKDPRLAEAGRFGGRPEVTFIGAIKWLDGMSAAEADEHWLGHVPVALRTQPLLTKYEQNVVNDVISWTPQTPAIHGYADCSIRTLEDLTKRFSATDEEKQDASRFVGKFHATYLGDAEILT